MDHNEDRNQTIAAMVHDHGEYLFRLAYLRLGERSAAEDAVQETFLAATRHFDDFRGEASHRTWLASILNNKCIDAMRKGGKMQSRSDLIEGDDDLNAYYDSFGGWRGWFFRRWSSDPEHTLQNKQFASALTRCISKLPASLRPLFSLKFLDQRPNQEICEALGVSAESVWTGLFRCRMHLRNCLEHSWYKPHRSRG